METSGRAPRPSVLVATPYPEVAMARAERLFDIGSRPSRMMRPHEVVEAAAQRQAEAVLISVGLALGEAEIEQLPEASASSRRPASALITSIWPPPPDAGCWSPTRPMF